MRMPNENENLVGKVCVCSVGRPAIVVGRKIFTFNHEKETVDCWIGLGLDGKGTWASKNPCILAESGQEFHDNLVRRFGWKMFYNG